MTVYLRNILAVIAGLVLGSFVNMGIVMLGPLVIPPPVGVDVSTAESLSQTIHLFEPRHFAAPFLAHALGTVSGALATYLLAVSHNQLLAWVIGGLFLCGGISAVIMIPAPIWFEVLDLAAAYLPMAWLAIVLGGSFNKAATN